MNRWPSWLDLESLFSAAFTVFFAVSTVVCRAMDYLTDGMVVLVRRTVCRQLPEPKSHPETNWLAYVLGHLYL